MGYYPGADLVYGVKIELDYEAYEEDFLEKLEDFLTEKKLSFVEAGNYYDNEEEAYGVIGIKKDLFPNGYLREVRQNEHDQWVQKAMETFTDDLLKEVKTILQIQGEIPLKLYQVVHYT